MLLYVAKGNFAGVIVKDLEMERLSQIFQVGPHNPYKWVRARENVMMKAEVRVIWPQAKECRQPVEAGKIKETNSFLRLPEGMQSANTLILSP